MTTRIESGGPATGVTPTETAPRVTPPPAKPFKQVMSAGAQAVVSGAESAVRALPGGPVLAAAFRPSQSSGVAFAGSGPAQSSSRPEGSSGTAAASGSGSEPSIEQALSDQSDMNLYYLRIQQQMNAENQMYTTYSNVLKARHETIKNAIGNIR